MRPLKKFTRLDIQTPDYRKSIAYIFLLGVFYGSLTFNLINEIENVRMSIRALLSWAFLIYILPSLAYGSIISFIRGMKRKWAYALVLINQFMVFIGFVSILFLNMNIYYLWWWIAFIYSINVLAILALFGISWRLRAIFIPLVYVAISSFIFNHFFNIAILGRGIILSTASLLGLGVLLLILIYLVDILFNYGINSYTKLSSIDLVSAIISGKKSRSLISGIGVKINTIAQALRVRTDAGDDNVDITIAVPWLHPGPIKNIGGGILSTEIIKRLKGEGFFWHAPSSHTSDPTNIDFLGSMIRKLRREPGKWSGRGTKTLRIVRNNWDIGGRRFGNFYLITLDSKREDDYELPIFLNIKQILNRKIIFVDKHNNTPPPIDKTLNYEETASEDLRNIIEELIKKLDRAKEYDLYGNISISEDLMCLLIEAGGEQELYITLDRNGFEPELKKEILGLVKGHINSKRHINSKKQRIHLLTTDAHTHIADHYSPDYLRFIDSMIEKTLSKKTRIRFGYIEEPLNNIEVLGTYYWSLKSAVSIISNLFIILLILLYVSIILVFL